MKVRRRPTMVFLAVLVLATIGAVAYVLAVFASGTRYDLPGVSLVKPAFAQGGSLPVGDAGISAYVQVAPESVDLDKAVDQFFDGVIAAGDNYVIGTYPVVTAIWGSGSATVNVYLDQDGWVVAYLSDATPLGELFRWVDWTGEQELGRYTTLAYTLESLVGELGEVWNPETMGWYDWANPDATHLVATADSGEGDTFWAVPMGSTVYRGLAYNYHSYGYWDALWPSRCFSHKLVKEKVGASPQTLVDEHCAPVFITDDTALAKGSMYKFTLAGWPADGRCRLGLAIVYRPPP